MVVHFACNGHGSSLVRGCASCELAFHRNVANPSFRSSVIAKGNDTKLSSHLLPDRLCSGGHPFLRIQHPEKPPLLTIQKLVLEDTYPGRILFQRSLAKVKVIGLHLLTPAKEPAGEPSPVMPLTYSDSKNSVEIGTIMADGAILEFESKAPGKAPLRLAVNKLSLYDVGSQKPITYLVKLHNPEPAGDINASGEWGPWDPAKPASVRVKGTYVYQNVNLASLPGVSGTLVARGSFSGTLGQINVNGHTDVANFRIEGASHSRPLKTEFRAVVDATKGDVVLNRVLASFDKTTLLFSGSVKDQAVDLHVSSGKARLEDLLDLFIAASHPAMSGNVTLQGEIGVPAGDVALLQKARMNGTFDVDAGLFSDKQTERELAKLSVSAVKGDKEEDRENPQTVLSNIKGAVTSAGGVAHLAELRFSVPGAHAKMVGDFNLLTYRSDMQGVLVTEGDISDATTGMKSWLLKAMTPFFRKKKHGRVVPFKISGPYGNTTVSLDLWRKK